MIFDIYYNFMSSSTSNSNLSIIFSKSIFRKIFVSFTLVAGLHPTSDDTSWPLSCTSCFFIYKKFINFLIAYISSSGEVLGVTPN